MYNLDLSKNLHEEKFFNKSKNRVILAKMREFQSHKSGF